MVVIELNNVTISGQFTLCTDGGSTHLKGVRDSETPRSSQEVLRPAERAGGAPDTIVKAHTILFAKMDILDLNLYGLTRDEVDYVMETFPIVKRKDIERYKSYRTKDMILAEYDKLAKSSSILATSRDLK